MTENTEIQPFSIVVPVYNEKDSVVGTVERIHGVMSEAAIHDYELIVVDDGSVDGTGALLDTCEAVVLRHSVNRGYGAALKTGIRAAKQELIVITDADGTYPVERIPELVRSMSGCDMAVGARRGENVNIPALRRLPKAILQTLASYVVDFPIPDLNSGLRVFRKNACARYMHILPNGFSFTSTITMAMLADGYEVRFLPIDYHEREGRSKIKPIRDTAGFFNMIVRTCMYFAPLRVFAPLSVFLALLAFIKLVIDIVYQPAGYFVISQTVLLLVLVAVQIFVLGMVADLIVRRSNRLL